MTFWFWIDVKNSLLERSLQGVRHRRNRFAFSIQIASQSWHLKHQLNLQLLQTITMHYKGTRPWAKLTLFNPFTPEFQRRTLPFVTLDTSIDAKSGFSQIINRMADSVDPDETAHNEPSHQDLHCFQWCLCWYVVMKGFNQISNSLDRIKPHRKWPFASDFYIHITGFVCVCLCWGFRAQSTQWGHVERGQFT